MWECPKCKAMNYEKGVCECCGFNGGKENTEGYRSLYPYEPIRTDEPWYAPRI